MSEKGVRSFEEWRSWALSKLTELAAPSEKEEVRSIASLLLADLERLDLGKLPRFLIRLYAAATVDERFLDIAPSSREVPAWLYGLK